MQNTDCQRPLPDYLFPKSQPSTLSHSQNKNPSLNFEDLPSQDFDHNYSNPIKMNYSIRNSHTNDHKTDSAIVTDEMAQHSYIAFHDNCLETSMPLEDIIGQIGSPKLSDKMQMILASNANFSESIIKSSFKAVDESRIKLENRDLQIELEISELKLQNLDKKVDGCLESSKNALAFNAKLSQNTMKILSPSRKSHQNTLRKESSQLISPKLSNVASSSHKNSPKLNSLSNDYIKGLVLDVHTDVINLESQDSPNKKTTNYVLPRQTNGSTQSESVYSAQNESNSAYALAKSIISQEADRKKSSATNSPKVEKTSKPARPSSFALNSYYEERVSPQKNTKKLAQSDLVTNNENKIDDYNPMMMDGKRKLKVRDYAQSTNTISSSTVLQERLLYQEFERPTEIFSQEIDTKSYVEDVEKSSKKSLTNEIQEKLNEDRCFNIKKGKKSFPREVILYDENGEEQVFILKPKERLVIEKLEPIHVTFLTAEEKEYLINQVIIKGNLTPHSSSTSNQILSVPRKDTQEDYYKQVHLDQSSYQMSGNMTGSSYNAVPQTYSSYRTNIDNSNIASVNINRGVRQTTEGASMSYAKSSTANVESQDETLHKRGSASLNNLNLHINDRAESPKFIHSDEIYSVSNRGCSVGYNRLEGQGSDHKRPELYFKKKITDFKQALSEFEEILSHPDTPLSLHGSQVAGSVKAKRVNSWDSQGLNSQDARTEESAADKNSLFNQAKRKSPVMHSIKEKPAKNLVIKVNDEYDIQGKDLKVTPQSKNIPKSTQNSTKKKKEQKLYSILQNVKHASPLDSQLNVAKQQLMKLEQSQVPSKTNFTSTKSDLSSNVDALKNYKKSQDCLYFSGDSKGTDGKRRASVKANKFDTNFHSISIIPTQPPLFGESPKKMKKKLKNRDSSSTLGKKNDIETFLKLQTKSPKSKTLSGSQPAAKTKMRNKSSPQKSIKQKSNSGLSEKQQETIKIFTQKLNKKG